MRGSMRSQLVRMLYAKHTGKTHVQLRARTNTYLHATVHQNPMSAAPILICGDSKQNTLHLEKI